MTDTEDEKNGKNKPTDFDRANEQGPVSPEHAALFDFLDGLFIDEKSYPESIEVRQVAGKNANKMLDLLKKYSFSTSAKPGKEKLVAMVNEILRRCQQFADVLRTPQNFHIAARNDQLSAEFYDRVLHSAKPNKHGGWGARGEELGIDVPDDYEENFPRSYNNELLRQQREMTGLLGGMIEGLLDRADRQAQAAFAQADRERARSIELFELNMRLVAADQDRQERADDRRMWRENIGKGLDMAWGLLPSALSALTGKGGNWKPGEESPEAYTLREFFKEAKDGGRITKEQFEQIFGDVDKDDNLIKQGILSLEQGRTLALIAAKQLSPDKLDDFLPTDGVNAAGNLEITQEQVNQLIAAGIPMEALAPLYSLFQIRNSKRQQATQAKKA